MAKTGTSEKSTQEKKTSLFDKVKQSAADAGSGFAARPNSPFGSPPPEEPTPTSDEAGEFTAEGDAGGGEGGGEDGGEGGGEDGGEGGGEDGGEEESDELDEKEAEGKASRRQDAGNKASGNEKPEHWAATLNKGLEKQGALKAAVNTAGFRSYSLAQAGLEGVQIGDALAARFDSGNLKKKVELDQRFEAMKLTSAAQQEYVRKLKDKKPISDTLGLTTEYGTEERRAEIAAKRGEKDSEEEAAFYKAGKASKSNQVLFQIMRELLANQRKVKHDQVMGAEIRPGLRSEWTIGEELPQGLKDKNIQEGDSLTWDKVGDKGSRFGSGKRFLESLWDENRGMGNTAKLSDEQKEQVEQLEAAIADLEKVMSHNKEERTQRYENATGDAHAKRQAAYSQDELNERAPLKTQVADLQAKREANLKARTGEGFVNPQGYLGNDYTGRLYTSAERKEKAELKERMHSTHASVKALRTKKLETPAIKNLLAEQRQTQQQMQEALEKEGAQADRQRQIAELKETTNANRSRFGSLFANREYKQAHAAKQALRAEQKFHSKIFDPGNLTEGQAQLNDKLAEIHRQLDELGYNDKKREIASTDVTEESLNENDPQEAAHKAELASIRTRREDLRSVADSGLSVADKTAHDKAQARIDELRNVRNFGLNKKGGTEGDQKLLALLKDRLKAVYSTASEAHDFTDAHEGETVDRWGRVGKINTTGTDAKDVEATVAGRAAQGVHNAAGAAKMVGKIVQGRHKDIQAAIDSGDLAEASAILASAVTSDALTIAGTVTLPPLGEVSMQAVKAVGAALRVGGTGAQAAVASVKDAQDKRDTTREIREGTFNSGNVATDIRPTFQEKPKTSGFGAITAGINAVVHQISGADLDVTPASIPVALPSSLDQNPEGAPQSEEEDLKGPDEGKVPTTEETPKPGEIDKPDEVSDANTNEGEAAIGPEPESIAKDDSGEAATNEALLEENTATEPEPGIIDKAGGSEDAPPEEATKPDEGEVPTTIATLEGATGPNERLDEIPDEAEAARDSISTVDSDQESEDDTDEEQEQEEEEEEEDQLVAAWKGILASVAHPAAATLSAEEVDECLEVLGTPVKDEEKDKPEDKPKVKREEKPEDKKKKEEPKDPPKDVESKAVGPVPPSPAAPVGGPSAHAKSLFNTGMFGRLGGIRRFFNRNELTPRQLYNRARGRDVDTRYESMRKSGFLSWALGRSTKNKHIGEISAHRMGIIRPPAHEETSKGRTSEAPTPKATGPTVGPESEERASEAPRTTGQDAKEALAKWLKEQIEDAQKEFRSQVDAFIKTNVDSAGKQALEALNGLVAQVDSWAILPFSIGSFGESEEKSQIAELGEKWAEALGGEPLADTTVKLMLHAVVPIRPDYSSLIAPYLVGTPAPAVAVGEKESSAKPGSTSVSDTEADDGEQEDDNVTGDESGEEEEVDTEDDNGAKDNVDTGSTPTVTTPKSKASSSGKAKKKDGLVTGAVKGEMKYASDKALAEIKIKLDKLKEEADQKAKDIQAKMTGAAEEQVNKAKAEVQASFKNQLDALKGIVSNSLKI